MENRNFQLKNIVNNIAWKFLERGASLAVTFVVNILLARLLDPSDHGLLAMVSVFVTIFQLFVTAGFGTALVQKDDADTLDFSSVFWLNLLFSAILYAILFIAAPFIAEYFGFSVLSPILRVLGIQIIICAVNSIQCAYISRNMLFKNYFLSTLLGKILSGIIGIAFAYYGFGVWALVAQSLALVAVETAVLWFRVKWRPTLEFSWKRGKALFAFAYKVTLAYLILTITDQFRNLIIGKRYTSEDLAFYDKGVLFPNCITTNISTALSAVMYPVLASKQDNSNSSLNACRKWVALFSYCMFPILTGLSVVGSVLIPLLLTSKWEPAIPYLRFACGIYATWVIEVPIRNTIETTGRADVCLKMQIPC